MNAVRVPEEGEEILKTIWIEILNHNKNNQNLRIFHQLYSSISQ